MQGISASVNITARAKKFASSGDQLGFVPSPWGMLWWCQESLADGWGVHVFSLPTHETPVMRVRENLAPVPNTLAGCCGPPGRSTGHQLLVGTGHWQLGGVGGRRRRYMYVYCQVFQVTEWWCSCHICRCHFMIMVQSSLSLVCF